jgi:hypothetical protein
VFLLITLFCTQKTAQTRFVFKNAGHEKSKKRGGSRKVINHMSRTIVKVLIRLVFLLITLFCSMKTGPVGGPVGNSPYGKFSRVLYKLLEHSINWILIKYV